MTWFKKIFLIATIFCIFNYNSFAQTQNTWDVLRKEFKLNHHVDNTLVKKQIQWLKRHPSYIEDLIQAKPFIYHIVNEIKERKLPGELALIPMIESDFDPATHSHKGAKGIWQFMPETARDLGLKRSTSFDERISIEPSTKAALKYLSYLNKFFKDDWVLALAAYSSGENKIQRLIRQQKTRNFWRLRTPQETKNYVPKILALAEVIKDPKKYNVKLPEIPYKPYFAEVTIKSQIDFTKIATLSNVPYKEVVKLNGGYVKLKTFNSEPSKILLPIEKVDAFKTNLAKLSIKERRNLAMRKEPPAHTVKHGESLTKIATKYNITRNKIIEFNPGIQNQKLKPGQKILLG